MPSDIAPKIRRLADQGIFIGTSSWKYAGWIGDIYSAARYETRGKFSKAKFEATCLEEYAETFPVVGGDFSFYQFPSDAFWAKLFASAPAGLKFGFKVPEEVTCPKWPTHARYGARGGMENPNFLDPDVFARLFHEALLPFGRTACYIFEFGTLPKSLFADVGAFTTRLNHFLGALPTGPRYSVEIRNADFLHPEYFAMLRAHNVAHVFNAWTRMPELHRQLAIDGAHTADFTVTRALLRYGRSYETAVKAFEPYDRIQDPYPESHEALLALIQTSLGQRRPAYIFVNNRLEGNAPGTIRGVIDLVEQAHTRANQHPAPPGLTP
jgi:uncharacterized protein YecE (DUF72 family)